MNIRILFLVIYTENKPPTNYAHCMGVGGWRKNIRIRFTNFIIKETYFQNLWELPMEHQVALNTAWIQLL